MSLPLYAHGDVVKLQAFPQLATCNEKVWKYFSSYAYVQPTPRDYSYPQAESTNPIPAALMTITLQKILFPSS